MSPADSGGGGGGGAGGDVSSAEPFALTAYSETGKRIDSELEATSTRLGAALATFETTCREYPTGVTTGLADQLRAFARRTVEDDVWVGRVADAFRRADASGLASATPSADAPVSDWSIVDRLRYVLEHALADLPGDVADRLRGMLTPENLAVLATVIAIWAASQFFGVGEVVDVVLIGIGLFTLGGDAIKVGQDLGSFAVGVARAKNQSDLNDAGKKLADAISVAGVDGAMALLFHKAGERMPERAPASIAPELVTPEGLVVRAPTAAIEPGGSSRMAISEPPPGERAGAGGGGGRPGGELPPANTPEGKAARWDDYQARTGGQGWDYERWSRVYDLNLLRARQANAAADAYQRELGFGRREVTVDVDGVPRRLDIADPANSIGYEYKTGYQTAAQDNLSQVARDAVLVRRGWSITWVFQGTASAPLLQALDDAGIAYSFR